MAGTNIYPLFLYISLPAWAYFHLFATLNKSFFPSFLHLPFLPKYIIMHLYCLVIYKNQYDRWAIEG